jgi:hypothetical protein
MPSRVLTTLDNQKVADVLDAKVKPTNNQLCD